VKTIVAAALLLVLSACVLPQTTVKTGSTQPSLAIKGAPADAVLYVDGISMGAAQRFDGNPNVLAVLEGAHQVEIRQGTNVVYREKVFVSAGETHAVTVLPGATP